MSNCFVPFWPGLRCKRVRIMPIAYHMPQGYSSANGSNWLLSLVIAPLLPEWKPHAKSVSERIWQISHQLRPNPAHVPHTLVSQTLTLQEVVRTVHGYNAWQISQHMRHNPISIRETSYGKPSALDQFPPVYDLQRGSLTLSMRDGRAPGYPRA